MSRIDDQPAFLIHLRRYRDTSAIAEFFTPEYGKLSGIIKGLYRNNKSMSQQRSLLQAGMPLVISFSNRGNLKTIFQVDAAYYLSMLQGHRLYSLLYINELIQRLYSDQDKQLVLFASYADLISRLHVDDSLEPALRQFELSLLHCLGYGENLSVLGGTEHLLEPQLYYGFKPQAGCYLAQTDTAQRWLGSSLVAIDQRKFDDPQVLADAKRLMRIWLRYYLGSKPLASRQLFVSKR